MRVNYLKVIITIIITFSLLIYSPVSTKAAITLFEDNFELSNYSKWQIIGGNWTIGEFQNSKWAVANTISDEFEIQAGDYSWTDYEFSVDILPISGIDKNLFFRVANSRSNGIPGLSIPVSYGIHITTSLIELQKWTPNNGYLLESYRLNIPYNQILKLTVLVQDNIIKIFTNDANTPIIEFEDTLNPLSNGRIALAAIPGSSGSEVWYDNVVVRSLDSTPTPILVIPGMGASWNSDALLNCKDDGYIGDWELAPYAEDIYNPLLQTLANSDHSVIPYYYDWRKDVRTHTSSIGNIIQSQDTNSDIVGHSMGGLLARAYLEETKENSKLNKLMTVGSPHKGSVLAYPAWSAGEIWNDNFIQRIAMTILLNLCSGENSRLALQEHIPSSQNLLPTFDYLHDKKINEDIDYSSQNAKNDWLPNYLFKSPFFGVKVGTLSGNGYDTLYKLDVKDANKKDLKEGNWVDGSPTRRYKTVSGDGTVLTLSSTLENADFQKIINKNHSDLVKSTEGIREILNFLEITETPITESLYQEESALILLSSQANVKFDSGQKSHDSNGISVILSPISKDYKINVETEKDGATFIVAQFLPNNKTLWKDYKVKKGTHKGTLKFNYQNIQENILEWD